MSKNIEDNMSEISKRIKTRREELGYSYQQLAEKTGMSKSTLQRYETGGIKNVPLSKVGILARALNTSPSYLLDWEDDMDSDDAEFLRNIYPHLKPLEELPDDMTEALPILNRVGINIMKVSGRYFMIGDDGGTSVDEKEILALLSSVYSFTKTTFNNFITKRTYDEMRAALKSKE